MKRCLRVQGRVQGVGFRRWTICQALNIGGISGYVYNDQNGDVLVYLEGTEDYLNRMQAALYKGPLFARVDHIIDSPEDICCFPPIENGVFKRI